MSSSIYKWSDFLQVLVLNSAASGCKPYDPQLSHGEPGQPHPAWPGLKLAEVFLQKPKTAHFGSNFTLLSFGFSYCFFLFGRINNFPPSLIINP
jgi:hypothetical protein